MPNKAIITISREYGSGGRIIAEKLAKKLGYSYYDRELITMAAKQSGIEEEMFENADLKATNSFLYSISLMSSFSEPPYDLPLNYKLFNIQSDVIKKVAEEGACVIVGRCSNFVLKDNPNCINIFIHADLDKRVQRAIDVYSLNPKNVQETVQKIDKRRRTYYNYHTNLKWGNAADYHLSFDSGQLGIDGAVELILDYIDIVNGR